MPAPTSDPTRAAGTKRRNCLAVVGILVGTAATVTGCGPGSGAGGSAPPATATPTSTPASAAAPQTDFAGLVDIGGGRQIYLQCTGSGTPTVILESGWPNASDVWSVTEDAAGGVQKSPSAVYPQLGQLTRVCAYDRPGTLRQDGTMTTTTPVPQPTTPQQGAADLRALLTAAKVPGPYVLAAHSLGGPIVRQFAGTHPNDTAGLVLIDTTTEFLQDEMTPAQLPFLFKQLAATTQALKAEVPGVEEFDLATWFAQLRAMPAAPAVPVTVLSADIIDVSGLPKLVPDAPADYPEAYKRAQLAAERDLAASYAGATLITKTDSSHNIPNIQPRLVTDAIRDVVDRARARNGG